MINPSKINFYQAKIFIENLGFYFLNCATRPRQISHSVAINLFAKLFLCTCYMKIFYHFTSPLDRLSLRYASEKCTTPQNQKMQKSFRFLNGGWKQSNPSPITALLFRAVDTHFQWHNCDLYFCKIDFSMEYKAGTQTKSKFKGVLRFKTKTFDYQKKLILSSFLNYESQFQSKNIII